jgi:hypothetical protein
MKMNREKDAGCRFADLHAKALHVVGEAWQCVLDAILRQHLRDVQVGPDPECYGDGEFAVSGGLTAHIEHVLNTVDLLLKRRCDGARYGLR